MNQRGKTNQAVEMLCLILVLAHFTLAARHFLILWSIYISMITPTFMESQSILLLNLCRSSFNLFQKTKKNSESYMSKCSLSIGAKTPKCVYQFCEILV